MNEIFFDKMQPFFGESNLKLLHMDVDNFVSSFKPIKGLIKGLKHLLEDFDLNDLDQFQ